MALSAKLSLRQSQSMVMTPQLLQSIRLLQFSQLELDRFIEEQIEINPLLEAAASDETASDPKTLDVDGDTDRDRPVEWPMDELEVSAGSIADRLDTSLENVFPDDPGRVESDQVMLPRSGEGGVGHAENDFDLQEVVAASLTLRDHLIEQIALTLRTDSDRAIAFELVDALDPNGYVEVDFADLASRVGCEEADIEAVLGALQAMDPPGVFARSLSECLALQLARRGRLDPAMAALLDNLPLLARRDFKALSRICGVGEADLVEMLAEIRALDPRPGLAFEPVGVESVVYDVEVTEGDDGTWRVELNPDALPRVLVNRDYYAHVARSGLSAEEKMFMSECLQNATWLERSLDQRATTILKVASEIVRQQDAFFVHGVSALKPMTMKMVADEIGMHESTVSRVSANKYMLTPRGMFEFRYFFTVAIGAGGGTEEGHSSEAVRQRIRELIEGETPDAVLSDDRLVSILKEEGIDIARRTVAKYRESMNIASSVQRRREKRALAVAGD
ncbi:RNA polymerase factor sigma-54 [Oricola thermophila]|uniref:RNA polymerase sigma-54 factor n=1 Tax=Oricola thermophila TaxID=2742145 RepID=A0A6N1VJG8_9HYPH|nr:RNA polymerase factor sigma-54 [Oricola thermophila]QKV19552.1 RNA polymerase factor sigma-54 [Oricola thermophila]